jgi:hypothetical protein
MGKAPRFEPTAKRMSCSALFRMLRVESAWFSADDAALHDRDFSAAKSILEGVPVVFGREQTVKTSPEAVSAIAVESRRL